MATIGDWGDSGCEFCTPEAAAVCRDPEGAPRETLAHRLSRLGSSGHVKVQPGTASPEWIVANVLASAALDGCPTVTDPEWRERLLRVASGELSAEEAVRAEVTELGRSAAAVRLASTARGHSQQSPNNSKTWGSAMTAPAPQVSSALAVNVYVVIWQDQHADTTVHVFASPETAVEWAKARAREFDRFGDLDEELTDAMRQDGWLYYGNYSCEGDHLRVVECPVQ